MEPIIVSALEGLFDEEAEAAIYEINDRRLCLRHSWVNASLQWQTETTAEGKFWAVTFRGGEWCNEPAWGQGHGGIRFCKRCKRIDCIHLFEESTYKIPVDAYVWGEYVIGVCRRCHRRILLAGWQVVSHSEKDIALIQEIANELGASWSVHPLSFAYGSYYYTDFPVAVARLLDTGEGERARRFIRETFTLGAEPGLSVLAVKKNAP